MHPALPSIRGLLVVCGVHAFVGCSLGMDLDLGQGRPPDASTPFSRAEHCGNGIDDDRDGRIDNGCPCAPSETQSCFTGAHANRRIGVCSDGVQTCRAVGVEWGDWGSSECQGDRIPSSEQCDGQDHDCDGTRDEGCPCVVGETRNCGLESLHPPCTGGVQRCDEMGHWGMCEGAILPASEICGDSIDNDCDGLVDTGCGCVPEPERCRDSIDNDCDGEIDELACTPDWVPSCDSSLGLDAAMSLRWVTASIEGAPLVRQHFGAMVWTGTEVFVWGGADWGTTDAFRGDGGLFNPVTNQWRPVSDVGAPEPRTNAIVLGNGREIFVWGGIREGYLRDGGLYDPMTSTWSRIPESPMGPFYVSSATPATRAAWTGAEFSIVTSAHEIAFFDPSRLRWRRARPFSGDPSVFDIFPTLLTPPTWTGRGWLFGGKLDSGSVPFWFYDVGTDTWTELSAISPIELLSEDTRVRYPTLVVLPDGRIAALGDERGNSIGLLSDRDDVWVLNLPAELAGTGHGWTLTYRGRRAPHLAGCARCDVQPGRCSGCPDTMMYPDLQNSYRSATAFGCGVLATHGYLYGSDSVFGLARFRLFDPTLTHFVEWPMPQTSSVGHAWRAHIFVASGEIAPMVSLGDIGWATFTTPISSSPREEPMRLVVFQR